MKKPVNAVTEKYLKSIMRSLPSEFAEIATDLQALSERMGATAVLLRVSHQDLARELGELDIQLVELIKRIQQAKMIQPIWNLTQESESDDA